MTDASSTPAPPILRTLAIALFAIVVVRAGWIGDDAYATLRTVDNVLNGEGLVYNVGERVQSYTHPLWMMLLTAVYGVWRHVYWAPLALGTVLSIGTLTLVGRRLIPAHAVWWLLAPSLSRAFVDYSTSGLENPLTHLLYAGLLAAWLTVDAPERRLRAAAVLGGLMVLNRMDTILLAAPPVLAAVAGAHRGGVPWRRVITSLVLAATPFLLWELFSLVYYGALVPNTALAKLSHELPRDEVLKQGGLYFLFQAEWDPLTLLVVAGGLLAPALHPRGRAAPVSAGIALYLAYVVWIGGDFMAGRFLTAPFLGALVVLARIPSGAPSQQLGVAATVVAVGLAGMAPPLLPDAPRSFGRIDPRGVTDERWYYVERGAGIGRARNDSRDPEMPWRHWATGLPRGGVKESTSIGFLGIDPFREVYLHTRYGLTDPLLARLPPLYFPAWRPGHFDRTTPAGFHETLTSGENRLEDPDVARLWDALVTVHRGPLFTWERWREIWRLHTGHYTISRPNDYRYANAVSMDPSAPPPSRSRRIKAKGAVKVDIGGAVMRLGRVSHAERVRIRRREDIDWRVIFEREGQTVGTGEMRRDLPRDLQLGWDTVRAPPSAIETGYDTVRVIVTWGEKPWVIQTIDVIDTRPASKAEPSGSSGGSDPSE